MTKFNETGVMFTENEKMQIVNTIYGFRGITTNGYSREFVVGNVKFRVIINSITGGYDANVTIECAVKGANGRYGNMQCYSNTIISKGVLRKLNWKLKIMDAFYKDIFGDVDSNDVAPVAEANENQNQVEDNATIFNTPNLDDVVENFHQMEILDSIIFDVLANGNNSYYVGKDGNITEVSNILNGYANIKAKVTLIKKNDNNNLVHIQLFDDDDYAYCSVILDETPSNKEWYSIIRGLHFHCDIHYNYPELERYIGGFQPLSAYENLELTPYGQQTLQMLIRKATDAYTASVKDRYNIF